MGGRRAGVWADSVASGGIRLDGAHARRDAQRPLTTNRTASPASRAPRALNGPLTSPNDVMKRPTRKILCRQYGDILKVGQILNTQNRRACMKRLRDVSEAREICKDG
ncbi:hypothetical protein EVAR_47664_1 [Eumeta japonica]|uniref:Uncharacterized protein n=1 Tax=Eumeta variegata TaxID=151549 RepID=A0A4C1XYH8_EUMVA|nr:hypothetical protein EVAR_47664_1 [Eumeta japonica]